MTKKNLFIWCCDLNKNQGEGIIANKFINDLKSINRNIKIVIKKPNKQSKNILYERFIYPFLGIVYLWKIYLTKKNNKICYVNYLPFWNFFYFCFYHPKLFWVQLQEVVYLANNHILTIF